MLEFEVLESRTVPAVTIIQQGATLSVYGEPQAANTIVVDGDATNVNVFVNGNESVFSGVDHLVLIGGDKGDQIVNNSTVDSSIYGLEGGDFIQAFAGDDFIVSGQGNDVVRDFLGNNLIYTNDDADADVVYGNKGGLTFVGAQDSHFAAPAPVFVSFNVLYTVGNNVSLYDFGTQILIINDSQVYFADKDIKAAAFVGTDENDFFANNTELDDYVYGFNGDDVLVGGLGDYSLLDGGQGNDVLVGRAVEVDSI